MRRIRDQLKRKDHVGKAMKNILFVSIAFPPKSDAEGLQVAKYLKYLLREGEGKFKVDAVTSKRPTLNMPVDESLGLSLLGVRDILEIPIYENRYTNFLLRKIAPRLANSPDSKFSFHLQASRVIKQLPVIPDLIYSRSFPPSSSVMAYKLKMHYRVPWVMHLSDLWADCPEHPYTGNLMSYQQSIEEMCFLAADVVCVTSRKTLAYYQSKYAKSAARIEYYPNVFDLEDYVAPVSRQLPVENEKLRVVHTGSLTGTRSAEPFLQAVHSLPIERQNELDLIFVGAIDARNRAILDRYNMDCVTYVGPVNYRRALEIQRSAHLLLLIDMPVLPVDRRVFFPSKILDYVLAQHPILALIDEGSEAHRVIEANGLGTCIERNDSRAVGDHLLWLLSNRNSSYFDARGLAMEFDAAENTKRLVDLFEELLRVGASGEGNSDRC